MESIMLGIGVASLVGAVLCGVLGCMASDEKRPKKMAALFTAGALLAGISFGSCNSVKTPSHPSTAPTAQASVAPAHG